MMELARLDPRLKLFILAGLSTASLVARSYIILLALFAISLFVLIAGGIGLNVVWVKLRSLFGLIVMLFILQCIFNRKGETLLSIFGAALVTKAGFETAVMVSLRLLVIILGALIVSSGDARDYLLALTSLKVPYEIAFMTLAALRFLPILRDESRDVLCAAQMRGLQIKKAGLRRQIGAYMSIVLPVVAGAIHRAEQLSLAMEARGFRAFPRRTSMRRLRMRKTDWTYMAIFCAALIAIFVSIR